MEWTNKKWITGWASGASDAMLTIESLWIYIVVPTALISVLVLIKLRQEKMGKRVDNEFKKEGARSSEKEATRKVAVEKEKTQTQVQSSEEKGSKDCPHYLGYLYMKKGRDSTYIPNECYGCHKLLQCLYSSNIIEKVYGKWQPVPIIVQLLKPLELRALTIFRG